MLRYWPALDGLRGVAVLAVMLFHAHAPLLQGGFLGVDIFFVLSGFLITCQLLQQTEQPGGVCWSIFFKKRLVRLQPALVAMLITYYLAWCAGWIPTPGSVTFRDILMALFAWAHWARAFEWFPPDYLGHAWSLGIEEQFYLLWALTLFLFGNKVVHPWRLTLVAACAAILSGFWMQWLLATGASPSRLYNGLDTRAMALLLGCALAGCFHTLFPFLLESKRDTPQQSKSEVLIFKKLNFASAAAHISLLLLLTAMTLAQWNHPLMFQWGYAGVGLLACLLIAAIVIAPNGSCGRLLSSRALVYTGKISYGLYLWHYPIIRVLDANAKAIGIGRPTAMVVALCLSFAAAAASYFWLEQPIKRRTLSHSN